MTPSVASPGDTDPVMPLTHIARPLPPADSIPITNIFSIWSYKYKTHIRQWAEVLRVSVENCRENSRQLQQPLLRFTASLVMDSVCTVASRSGRLVAEAAGRHDRALTRQFYCQHPPPIGR